jgi:hypothetical protein
MSNKGNYYKNNKKYQTYQTYQYNNEINQNNYDLEKDESHNNYYNGGRSSGKRYSNKGQYVSQQGYGPSQFTYNENETEDHIFNQVLYPSKTNNYDEKYRREDKEKEKDNVLKLNSKNSVNSEKIKVDIPAGQKGLKDIFQ